MSRAWSKRYRKSLTLSHGSKKIKNWKKTGDKFNKVCVCIFGIGVEKR